MNTKLSKDDAFEVSDSTDWLETPLAPLCPVDSALRCQVCKDFYSTPMITSCAHTFCSVCIRRCLSNDGKCPACRSQDQELKLRFNGAMEELVQAFVKARPEILAHARRVVEAKKSVSPKRRRDEVDLVEDDGPRKRTRSSGRKQSSQRVVVVDSEEDPDEYIPGKQAYLDGDVIEFLLIWYNRRICPLPNLPKRSERRPHQRTSRPRMSRRTHNQKPENSNTTSQILTAKTYKTP